MNNLFSFFCCLRFNGTESINDEISEFSKICKKNKDLIHDGSNIRTILDFQSGKLNTISSSCPHEIKKIYSIKSPENKPKEFDRVLKTSIISKRNHIPIKKKKKKKKQFIKKGIDFCLHENNQEKFQENLIKIKSPKEKFANFSSYRVGTKNTFKNDELKSRNFLFLNKVKVIFFLIALF